MDGLCEKDMEIKGLSMEKTKDRIAWKTGIQAADPRTVWDGAG